MRQFAETCVAIAATAKKLEKIRIVAEYLKSRPVEEASVSAVFLSGKPFPAWEEATLQVGGRSLWQVVGELSGKSDAELTAAYRKLGDLGAAAGEVLGDGRDPEQDKSSFARPDRQGYLHPTTPKAGALGTAGLSPGEPGQSLTLLGTRASRELSVREVEAYFRKIASARGTAAKTGLV